MYRQGDVLLVAVKEIPKAAKPAKPDNGRWILAYGEVTGHHHSFTAEKGVELVTTEQADELRVWLSVTTAEPVPLIHQEHDTILIPPGEYRVLRQLEYSPEATRKVQD